MVERHGDDCALDQLCSTGAEWCWGEGRLYEELKGQPLYVAHERIGFREEMESNELGLR